MGGYIAFEFLRRWRRRVRGLILMDTRAEADTPDGKKARDAAAMKARESGAEAVADELLPRMVSPTTLSDSPETVERVRVMLAATPVAGMIGALGALRDRGDSRDLLPSLAGLPTLVLVGEDDALTPAPQAREMAEAIPGSRFTVITGAGHLPPMERPSATTEIVAEFLRALS